MIKTIERFCLLLIFITITLQVNYLLTTRLSQLKHYNEVVRFDVISDHLLKNNYN
jgi:hypothetical protein